MIDYWLSFFSPSVFFRSPITPFDFFAPLPLKIALKGAIGGKNNTKGAKTLNH